MEDFWKALLLGLSGDNESRGCAVVFAWAGFGVILGLVGLLLYTS